MERERERERKRERVPLVYYSFAFAPKLITTITLVCSFDQGLAFEQRGAKGGTRRFDMRREKARKGKKGRWRNEK